MFSSDLSTWSEVVIQVQNDALVIAQTSVCAAGRKSRATLSVINYPDQ